MTDWQTMDTAPKDGTAVLLFVENTITTGWYENDEWHVVSLPVHGCNCCSYPNDPPTHWMKKPELPK